MPIWLRRVEQSSPSCTEEDVIATIGTRRGHPQPSANNNPGEFFYTSVGASVTREKLNLLKDLFPEYWLG